MCIDGEMRWFWPRNPTVSTTSEAYSGLALGALLVEVLGLCWEICGRDKLWLNLLQ